MSVSVHLSQIWIKGLRVQCSAIDDNTILSGFAAFACLCIFDLAHNVHTLHPQPRLGQGIIVMAVRERGRGRQGDRRQAAGRLSHKQQGSLRVTGDDRGRQI